jgi:hypothetical protein
VESPKYPPPQPGCKLPTHQLAYMSLKLLHELLERTSFRRQADPLKQFAGVPHLPTECRLDVGGVEVATYCLLSERRDHLMLYSTCPQIDN